MRFFEIFLLIGLFFSAAGMLFIKNAKQKVIIPVISMALSFASIFVEGIRFAMVPAYIMTIILFILSFSKLFLRTSKRHPILKGFGIVAFCLSYMLSITLPCLQRMSAFGVTT
jgi:hypothetical protein